MRSIEQGGSVKQGHTQPPYNKAWYVPDDMQILIFLDHGHDHLLENGPMTVQCFSKLESNIY